MVTAGAGAATSPTTNSETVAAAMVSRLTPNVATDTEPRISDFTKNDECKRTSAGGSDGAEYAGTSCTCSSCPRLPPTPSAAVNRTTTTTTNTTTTTSTSCTLDSVALSEATRNLTQTLKKLIIRSINLEKSHFCASKI
ncbi:hypothetical protein U1Q18_046669 [Sarracenia purpurea var. burkii]